MKSWQLSGNAGPTPRQTVSYARPAWTAELRRIEAQILRGVTWS
jgi:hypothetical protein